MSKQDLELNPSEAKRQAIIEAAAKLVRVLVAEQYDDAVRASEESFQEDEDAKEPEVKLSAAITFKPLAEEPEVGVTLTWSQKHKAEAAEKIDPRQMKLGIKEGGES